MTSASLMMEMGASGLSVSMENWRPEGPNAAALSGSELVAAAIASSKLVSGVTVGAEMARPARARTKSERSILKSFRVD